MFVYYRETSPIIYMFLYNDMWFVVYYRDTYPMILVANKVDLVQQRKVSEDDGRTLATRLNVSVKVNQRKEFDCMMEQYIKSLSNNSYY